MTELREIAGGLRFPEGPVAMADGSVLLVEIEARWISRVSPEGNVERLVETGGGPNGLAIGPEGAAYVTNNGGFAFHEDEHGLRPTIMPEDYSGGRLERVDLATGRDQRAHP